MRAVAAKRGDIIVLKHVRCKSGIPYNLNVCNDQQQPSKQQPKLEVIQYETIHVIKSVTQYEFVLNSKFPLHKVYFITDQEICLSLL